MAIEPGKISLKLIAQAAAEVVRVAVQAMVVAMNRKQHKTWRNTTIQNPKYVDPMMKQPTFNWKAQDKYSELKNVRLEVNNVFKSYSMSQTEKIQS